MPWLEWIQTLTTVSQRGLAYSKNPFDRENYELLRSLCAQMIAHSSPTKVVAVHELLSAQTGYPTPKVDVRAAVFRGHELLLVKETQDGKWALPGGWADLGVSPAEMAVKEVREESGLEVRATQLLAVFGKKPPVQNVFSVYKLIFRCEFEGGTARTSHETSDVAFFDKDQLPELSLHRTHPRHLSVIFERFENPTLPTYFE
jgi:ADP-ribose pyrophosphatase YjhB (NUDIX family)